MFLKIENNTMMKKQVIKNVSRTTLSLFARKNGKEAKFEIGPGKEIIADNYETRTIKT